MTARFKEDHLKFSPSILSRLGEELNPHPDQGIIELVRNSYDADANNCKIKLIKVNRRGGCIRIIDDGHGMDLSEISSGWLVLGRSEKTRRRRTKLGRRTVGDKGLGRLAALRMGDIITLVTRPVNEPLFEHRLQIDWREYDNVNLVEDVPLSIQIGARRAGTLQGTEIIIENLRSTLNKKEIQRLARSLLLLSDPFIDSSGFKPILDVPEYKDMEKVVRSDFFSSNEFHLTAKINNMGIAKASVFDWKGKRVWTADHETLHKKKKPYEAPSASFEFWAFNLGKKEFLTRSLTIPELKTWLRAVGGVHFYLRELRVYPYGDKGHDWLDMNLRRSQTPELRPSTNNSIGRICVDDPENRLKQKTDRTGFIENTAFEELRSFAQEALEWMADSRLKRREQQRTKKRATVIRTFQTTKKALDKAIKKVPEKSQEEIKDIIRNYELARTKQVEVLKEEVQLYRTLSTVGTTFAVFAHELKQPLDRIANQARAIEDRGRTVLKDQYTRHFQGPVNLIKRSASALAALPKLALKLLERDKRETKILLLNEEIPNLLNIAEPFFKEFNVHHSVDLIDEDVYVYGSTAAIQSILMNLITNATYALILHKSKQENRTILFRIQLARSRIQIHVLDNGPGIRDLTVDEIWLPGKTTKPDGTGLGLTIVRDTVADLGGRSYAIGKGELGGAEIVVELPVAEDE